jgi:hypothetical protein
MLAKKRAFQDLTSVDKNVLEKIATVFSNLRNKSDKKIPTQVELRGEILDFLSRHFKPLDAFEIEYLTRVVESQVTTIQYRGTSIGVV